MSRDHSANFKMETNKIQTLEKPVAAMVVGSDPWLGVCLFCENERQLKPSCTKQRWKVCKDHFMVTCPKCGHEGFWMENMKRGSFFACFSLDCNWRSETPPHIAPVSDGATKTI